MHIGNIRRILFVAFCFLALLVSANPVWADVTKMLESEWLSEPFVEWAVGQPATTTHDDAAGGCDGIKDGQYGFHTDLAEDPWWQVDLGSIQMLSRVVIWNRGAAADRANRLLIRLSPDGKQWDTVYRHNGATFIGFGDRKPLDVKMENRSGRYVRIQLPGKTYLHLDEIEVFGMESPNKNLALKKPANQCSLSTWSVSHNPPAQVDWARRTRESIDYCRRLMQELSAADVKTSDFEAPLQRLVENAAAPGAAMQVLYLEIRKIERQLVLANPLLNFDAILFNKRVPGSFNHMSDQYYGWWSKPGGGLFILRDFKTGNPSIECLTESFKEPGSFLRPTLSYDGQKVLFAWCRYYPTLAAETNKLDKANVPEDAFYHLFEMNIDGSSVRKLTSGKYDDFDGRYLPGGRIVFLSTRRGQSLQVGRESATQTLVQDNLPDSYVRCGGGPERPVAVYTLHTINADGGNLCAISPFEMFEWTPDVANDGSIIYSRWDYIDRDNMPYMGLWTINPDGSNSRLVYKNYTHSPHCTFEPKCVPNSSKIVFTASGHHSQTMGSLVLLDPTVANEGKDPIVRLTPEVAFPEIEGWPKTYYTSPWPLSERYHLVAWGQEGLTVPGPEGWARWHSVQRPPNGMALYLFDAAGRKELLYCDPDISCVDPIPLRSRPMPPVVTSIVNWDGPKDGCFFLADVYQGLKTVKRGDIKALRLVAVPPKTHPTMNFPSMGITADDPGKCVLGTVPVEADGSAYFRVPAGVIVFFQALDQNNVAVQTMRSISYVQPGQTLSCVGCHENRQNTPMVQTTLATSRAPSRITPGPTGSWPLRFDHLVQPVLDINCVSCHSPAGSNPQAVKFDLTAAKAYESLVGYGKPSLSDQVRTAYRLGRSIEGEGIASRSVLLTYLRTHPAHSNIILDNDSLNRFRTWMDTYAQRLGSFSPEQEKELVQFRSRSSELLVQDTIEGTKNAPLR